VFGAQKVEPIAPDADHDCLMFDIREFTHLGRDIDAVLDKQGADATVDTVRAEMFERFPRSKSLSERMELFARALGVGSVTDARRKLDELIVKRMARRMAS
jgi:hypothetical protein